VVAERAQSGHPLRMRSVPTAPPVSANRQLAAFAALAVVAAAFVIALFPFSDHGQRCGPPITSAGHGKTVITGPDIGAFLPYGVREQLPIERTTYCRQPARVRLAIAGGMIVALPVFAVRWRVLDPRLRAVRLPDH
jgi:hypothetical protein